MTKTKKTEAPKKPFRQPSAWLVVLGTNTQQGKHRITLSGNIQSWHDISEDDGLLIAEDVSGELRALSFYKIARVRKIKDSIILYFCAVTEVNSEPSLDSLGIEINPQIEWSIFNQALQKATGKDFDALDIISDQVYVRELLKLAIEDDLLGPADGPNEEVKGVNNFLDRYPLGRVAPIGLSRKSTSPLELLLRGSNDEDELDVESAKPYEAISEIGQEVSPISGSADPDEEPAEQEDSTNLGLVSSSVGMTFCMASGTKSLQVTASWGKYKKHIEKDDSTGKTTITWRRTPMGGSALLDISSDGKLIPDTKERNVIVTYKVRKSITRDGELLVTLFLVNTQLQPLEKREEAWLFQAELIVRDPDGKAVFRRKPPLVPDGHDEERESLEMLYRKRPEFASGHNTSVSALPDPENCEQALEVRINFIPSYEVASTETPLLGKNVPAELLDMRVLAVMPREELIGALNAFTTDYADWITSQKSKLDRGSFSYDASLDDSKDLANDAIARCKAILSRLNEGINTLASSNEALEAFRFANLAMADQRVRSIYSLKKRRKQEASVDAIDADVSNHSWRAFQLAFVLLAIPALANPAHKDRASESELQSEADLLWFPTGGGKTEAYLGVAAFAMAIRRLQDGIGDLDSTRGLGVVMRYTLRLLTLQQFQRSTTLICAMEALRLKDPKKWGRTPFSIGLWVGQKSTPNTTEESHKAITELRDKGYSTGSSPGQLTSCPWCGSAIAAHDNIEVNRDTLQTKIYCSDLSGECDYSNKGINPSGLPVVVVDEEIYRRPPSMLIATADKFAGMAWKGEVGTLFGKISQECTRHGFLWPDVKECTGNHPLKKDLPATTVKQVSALRPPDLIIQDEFHLISGPLGTVVGLYEAAIDSLCSWQLGDKTVRPKIIASTATVRKAAEQVKNVFLRQMTVFPPHGVDVEDNYFSKQVGIKEKYGRLYLGICFHGGSKSAMLIRIYVALLTASQYLFDRFGEQADPYMTLVGYFNSLRELGGMNRLCSDDVKNRSYRVNDSITYRPGFASRPVQTIEELTSRVSSSEIPKTLDRLEIKHKKIAKALKTKSEEDYPIDIVLASNMLSVGVDISRLGVMIVNSQPKTTAEYIQATSRVGRSSPGLVITAFSWARPRDLSHYETFECYHATFYKHVEAQSVTPFSPRALDRALTGTLISLLRLSDSSLNPNAGAEQLTPEKRQALEWAKELLQNRAANVTGSNDARLLVGEMYAKRLDSWMSELSRAGRNLGYEKKGGSVVAPLLKRPSKEMWSTFTVPTSMREVEPGVNLIMDTNIKVSRSGEPDWKAYVEVAKGSANE